jgi:hypothetical protein
MTRTFLVHQSSNRWIASITGALVDRGVITTDELGRRMADVGRRTRESA